MDNERDAYTILQVLPEADEAVIRAAYRALAAVYHPDRDPSASATRRMAELNAAFDRLRTPDRRAVYDRLRRAAANRGGQSTVVVPPRPQPARPAPGTLDFGRYSGWTIKQLARQDPDYLRWLSRHSSGIRFRREIEETMGAAEPVPAASSGQRRRR